MKNITVDEQYKLLIENIKDTNTETSNDLLKLKMDLDNFHKEIEESAISSFSSIKKQVAELDRIIEEKTLSLDNYENKLEADRLVIRTNHSSILINAKNKLMNYEIQDIDQILNFYDSYLLELDSAHNNMLFETNKMIQNQISSISEITDLLTTSLLDYQTKLKEFNQSVQKYTNSFSKKIVEMSNIFSSLYDDYQRNIDKNNSEFEKKYLSITKDKPELLVDNPNLSTFISNHEKYYQNMYDLTLQKYQAQKDKYLQEFKDISMDEIKKIEETLSIAYLQNPNLFSNYDKEYSNLKEQLIENEYTNEFKKIITKIENIYDFENLQRQVTRKYKKQQKEIFNQYKSLHILLDQDYLKTSSSITQNRFLFDYTARKDSFSAQLENEVFTQDIYQKINDLFFDKVLVDLQLNFDYALNQEQILVAIKKTQAQYNYEKKFLLLNLESDLFSIQNILFTQYNGLELKQKSHISSLNSETKQILINTEMITNALNYQLKKAVISKKYISDKYFLAIEYQLFMNNREFELLEPRSELKRLLDEYDVHIANIQTMYDNEMIILNDNKKRLELSNLSNYDFLITALEHQAKVSISLFDNALHEYNLRIKSIDSLSSKAIGFNQHQINRIVEKYLDLLEEINIEKELKIRDISVKRYIDNSYENLFNLEDELNVILTEHKQKTQEVYYSLKNDINIKEFVDNVSFYQKEAIESIAVAQNIRNQSLKSALESYEAISKEINRIHEIYEKDTNFDYMDAMKNYYDKYTRDKGYFTDVLEVKSDEYLDALNEIAYRYLKSDFKQLLSNIENEYATKSSALDLEFTNKQKQLTLEDTQLSNLIESNTDNYLVQTRTMMEDRRNKVQKFNLDLAQNIQTAKDDFKKYCLLIDKEHLKSVKAITKKAKENRYQVIKLLSIIDTKQADLTSLYQKTIKIHRKTYSFEYNAFKDDLKKKYRTVIKETKQKYKNATVYDLTKK